MGGDVVGEGLSLKLFELSHGNFFENDTNLTGANFKGGYSHKMGVLRASGVDMRQEKVL